ncbi:hypothetical protein C8R43DRAFT_440083 [Mycena crocata]|nr:hypothetical protein C8R43DRAFT_440083 [Mycena crocata]
MPLIFTCLVIFVSRKLTDVSFYRLRRTAGGLIRDSPIDDFILRYPQVILQPLRTAMPLILRIYYQSQQNIGATALALKFTLKQSRRSWHSPLRPPNFKCVKLAGLQNLADRGTFSSPRGSCSKKDSQKMRCQVLPA